MARKTKTYGLVDFQNMAAIVAGELTKAGATDWGLVLKMSGRITRHAAIMADQGRGKSLADLAAQYSFQLNVVKPAAIEAK